MKALLLNAYSDLRIAELPCPTPAPDEVLVQVAACGICGSDVHGYDGSSGRRIPPIVMGHEAAGTIAAVGSGVNGLAVGDRVTFDSTVFCGTCPFCLRGEVNLCGSRQVLGVSCDEYRRSGAFAEYLIVPARIVYPLPEDISFAEAATLEAVAVALHAVRVSAMRRGESVLVIGAGMIGVLLLQAARAAGASTVSIADIDQSRLALAATFQPAATLHASGAELTSHILQRTGQTGVDHVLEAVGHESTILTAIDCVRNGGTVTLVGNTSPRVNLPLQKIVSRQIRMQGSCASAGEYPEAIRLVANGSIAVKPLITAIAPLEEGPSWFGRLHAREPNLMKIVLDPRSKSGAAQ